MPIYLTKAHLKNALIKELLADDKILFGYKVQSFTNFIAEIVHWEKRNYLNEFKAYQKRPLKRYRESIKESCFLDELNHDRFLLAAYAVKPQDLAIDKEYRALLAAVKPADFNLIQTYLLTHDFHDYYIEDAYYDLFTQKIIDTMIKKGAKVKKHPPVLTHGDYQINVNLDSDALDTIFQYLINEKIDLNTAALVADEKAFPLIEIRADNYGIPLNFNKAFKQPKRAKLFIALMDFYLKQDLTAYLNLVNLGLYQVKDLSAFNEYFTKHVSSLEDSLYNNFLSEERYYAELEKKADKVHEKYLPLLKDFKAIKDFKSALTYCFTLIAHNDELTIQIKEIIEQYKDDLETAYPFIKEEILRIKTLEYYENALTVTSYRSDIYRKDLLFILSPTIEVYPAFKAREGIIDEEALLKTTFPSLQKRYDNHLKNFAYFTQSKTSYYFLARGTLNGTTNEYSEEFLNFPKVKLPLLKNNPPQSGRKQLLSTKRAEQLFFKEKTLTGSVTSLENYFRCPYAYFLNYGLKLKTPYKKEINNTLAGSIIHQILSTAIKAESKAYPQILEACTAAILKQEEAALAKLYPNDLNQIAYFAETIAATIKEITPFFVKLEANTSFKPLKEGTEKEFNTAVFTDNNYNLTINGRIDRIDSLNDTDLRIIDYKTYAKSFSASKALLGLDLQLLTYAYITQIKENKTVLGAYYLNVGQAFNDNKYFKVTDSGKFTDNELHLAKEENFIKLHKLSGLNFEEYSLNADEGQFIVGVGKDYFTRIYPMEIIDTFLKQVWQKLIEKLTAGNIELTPQVNACTNCPYSLICHYRGYYGLRNEALGELKYRNRKGEIIDVR